MTDTQEFSHFTKEVPRGKRGEVFGIDVPHRAEQLNQAVAAILHSLAVSTPELTYVPAQAERRVQATPAVVAAPVADPRLSTARVYGSDGASINGNYVRPVYTAPGAEAPAAPAPMPGTEANAEALRTMTGVSRAQELAMEANVAADFLQPNEMTPRPETQGPNPDLEAEARFLINQVFGTQEDQHELA